eukprot:3439079-Alexandrium_andersonii.AAC.1
MDDADIEDMAGFREPGELGDPARSVRSDAPGVPARGSQLRDDITGAVLPSELVMAARAEEIKFMEYWGPGASGASPSALRGQERSRLGVGG